MSLHVIAWLGFSTVIIVLPKRSHSLIPWEFELDLLGIILPFASVSVRLRFLVLAR